MFVFLLLFLLVVPCSAVFWLLCFCLKSLVGAKKSGCQITDEHGYVADLGRNLYDPEISSDVSFDTLNRYQQRHNSLNSDDPTAGCYAVMTPKGELIKIMKKVGEEMLQHETNPFRMDDTPLELEGRIYRKLVADTVQSNDSICQR